VSNYWGDTKLKVIVIGGGIIGLFAGYYLAKRGVNIAIVDNGSKNKASIYNAGVITPTFAKAPKLTPMKIMQAIIDKGAIRVSILELLKDPRWFIKASLSYKKADPVIKLLMKISLDLYYNFFYTEKIDIDLNRGVLALFRSLEEAKKIAEQVGGKLLDSQNLIELGFKGFEGGVYSENDIAINPEKLYVSLCDRMKEMGCNFIIEHAIKIREENNIVKVTLSKGENLVADYLIIAAGAWTTSLCKYLGYNIRLKPARGLIMLFKANGDRVIPVTSFLEDYGIMLSQHSHGLLRVASFFEISGFNTEWSIRRKNHIMTILRKHIDAFKTKNLYLLKEGTGFRPCSIDLKPIIGKLPKHKRIYISTGHCRQGVSLAPVSGSIISSMILGEKPPVEKNILESISP
jgi:D-amino-acid dehydrogenase